MKNAPAEMGGAWSPLLAKVADCEEAAGDITDFLLQPFAKKEVMNELRGLLITNLAYLTPTTAWFLEDR